MNIRHIDPQKSIRFLTVGLLIYWAVAGYGAEQWDTKTSARVNLRRNPSSNGVILSIVPKGHKVRIMEKKGRWSRVDVEGDIHGRGWVYAEYLKEILPIAPETESASHTGWVELESGEQEKNFHPAEPPKARREGEQEKSLRAPLSGKTSIADVKTQPASRNELRETKNETGALSKVEIPTAGKPAPFATSQAPPAVRTENESKVLSQVETPMAGGPVYVPPAQPPYAGFKLDALGASQKYPTCAIERGNTTPYQKSLPGGEKQQGGSVPDTSSWVREKAGTEASAVAASLESSAVSIETKRSINRRESMGPIEIALKLLSIALSCLVILFLHRANKIATNHYDALMKLQHMLYTRQHR